MAEYELSLDDKFEHVRGLIDDVLRSNVSSIGPHLFDDDDVTDQKVENPILGEWVVLTYWTDVDGEHHYVRVSSPHLAPHSRDGLLSMFRED